MSPCWTVLSFAAALSSERSSFSSSTSVMRRADAMAREEFMNSMVVMMSDMRICVI